MRSRPVVWPAVAKLVSRRRPSALDAQISTRLDPDAMVERLLDAVEHRRAPLSGAPDPDGRTLDFAYASTNVTGSFQARPDGGTDLMVRTRGRDPRGALLAVASIIAAPTNTLPVRHRLVVSRFQRAAVIAAALVPFAALWLVAGFRLAHGPFVLKATRDSVAATIAVVAPLVLWLRWLPRPSPGQLRQGTRILDLTRLDGVEATPQWTVLVDRDTRRVYVPTEWARPPEGSRGGDGEGVRRELARWLGTVVLDPVTAMNLGRPPAATPVEPPRLHPRRPTLIFFAAVAVLTPIAIWAGFQAQSLVK
ncbi:MAG: hypothetical protein ACYDH6_24490 [Acidimicrobiales bacterium]